MWQLYQWENCHILVPTLSGAGVNVASSRWLSSSVCPLFLLHLFWLGITDETGGTWMPTQPLFIPVQLFTVSAADCVQDDKMKTICQCEEISLKSSGNYYIWCFNTKVDKAVFQWRYLSCSVPSPCNDDLLLFSVLCSIFIYDQAFFHCISLDLSPISVPYLQLMKKIKKRHILFTVSNTFSIEWH